MRLLRCLPAPPALADAERVVLFSLAGMGNTIFAIPLAAELRRRAAHAKLVIVTANGAAAEAARLFGLADEVCIRDDILRFRPDAWLAAPPLARSPDYAFAAFTTSARPALIGRLWRARARIGHDGAGRRLLTHALAIREGVHEARLNLDLLRAVGEAPPEDAWKDYPPPKDLPAPRGELADAARPLIAVHPGSGGQLAAKRWAAERFAAVADAIQGNLGGHAVLVGGPEERPIVQSVVRAMKTEPIDLAGTTSVAQLASVLRHCDAVLASDTGVLHLGTAVGTPCVGIYGPTDWRRTGPFGRGHILLRADVDCSPCYTARTMGRDIECSRDYECLRAVTVEQVVEAISSVIRAPAQGGTEDEGLDDHRS
jgi:ADP-heptose:LPS heptosyltransferase